MLTIITEIFEDGFDMNIEGSSRCVTVTFEDGWAYAAITPDEGKVIAAKWKPEDALVEATKAMGVKF